MVIPGERVEKGEQVNSLNSDMTHNHDSVPKCTRIPACVHFQEHPRTPKFDLNHRLWSPLPNTHQILLETYTFLLKTWNGDLRVKGQEGWKQVINEFSVIKNVS